MHEFFQFRKPIPKLMKQLPQKPHLASRLQSLATFTDHKYIFSSTTLPLQFALSDLQYSSFKMANLKE